MKKSLIAIMITGIMMMTFVAPLITQEAYAADPAYWYMTVDGVLDSDYYSLYPFETDESLKIGFSKWGELINSAENVGLEYGEVDPFAYPVGSSVSTTVPKRMWVQGWYINISYVHRTLGPRNVWAGALHSDTIVYGNDWIRVDWDNDYSTAHGLEDFRDQGYLIGSVPYASTLMNGGRKTNGTAETYNIEVLYNGPREFIAVCRTTIYDHLLFEDDSRESDVALAQIAITVRFDKVKKCVVLYKDVKSLLVEKEGIKMKIQFSNRGEVDLGTALTGVSSYAHFWTEGESQYNAHFNDTQPEGQPTVYDADWHLIRTEDPMDQEYPYYSAAGPFPQDPDQYPYHPATYDVAQALNPYAGYVWSAGFWPSLSDWSIDGWDQWWHSMTAFDPHYIDYRVPDDEPYIPFYIGEWDFVLYHTLDAQERTQFRGVTQYAVTNWHDADDYDFSAYSNTIDSEMDYYLQETFNPWDLKDAVHKKTERWVEFPTDDFTTEHRPFLLAEDWDEYCVFAERVIDLETGNLLRRNYGYSVYVDSDGYGVFDLPGRGHYKVLYSTEPYFELVDIDPFEFDDSLNMTVEGAYTDEHEFEVLGIGGGEYLETTDTLDCDHRIGIDDFRLTTTLLDDTSDFQYVWTPEFDYGLQAWEYNFGIGGETTYQGSWDFIDNYDLDIGFDNGDVSFLIDLLDVHWTITPPIAKTILVDQLDFEVNFQVTVSYNATEDEMNITALVDLDPADTIGASYMYYAHEPGRYEWVTVGRDAATVDSAGSALIAEAFDSYKSIGIGIGGADMQSALVYDRMPYVMSRFGAGTSVNDYKDRLLRAAINDDWCTYWPVASSNMITVGGPLANVLSYYVNDFTDAFYGHPAFSGTAYTGKITGIPCWNRNWPTNAVPGYNTYESSASTGYAVISTYKDINGTVIFDVYGHWGRDTYYASLWLHGDEARGFYPHILELQAAPKGATSIILEIDYSDPSHPYYSIPEVLGTISETHWDHYLDNGTDFCKGGIHDP